MSAIGATRRTCSPALRSLTRPAIVGCMLMLIFSPDALAAGGPRLGGGASIGRPVRCGASICTEPSRPAHVPAVTGDPLGAWERTAAGPAAAAAPASDFTWSGLTPWTDGGNWSSGANWAGGSAPSGSVGTLDFAALPGCDGKTDACYQSNDDVSGIAAGAILLDDGVDYNIGGADALTLGPGGLTAAPSASDVNQGGYAYIDAPLTLSADQSWSVTGGTTGQQLQIGGTVGGSPSTLDVTLSGDTFLTFDGDAEVGNVTVSGGSPAPGFLSSCPSVALEPRDP